MKNYEVIPKYFLGVKTDVIEIGKFKMNNENDKPQLDEGINFLSQKRPIEPGYNIGPYKISSLGTLGGIVFDNNTNDAYMLTCSHVLYCGDSSPYKRSLVIQPAINVGGGYAKNIVGFLAKANELNYYEQEGAYNPNQVDCAIAKILPNVKHNVEIYKIGSVKKTGEAKINMPVKKVGAISGYTEGTIDIIKTTFYLEMYENIYSLFENQIIANLHASAGDSGSLVINDKNEAIGLLIGSAEATGKAYITPIETVINYLNVHL